MMNSPVKDDLTLMENDEDNERNDSVNIILSGIRLTSNEAFKCTDPISSESQCCESVDDITRNNLHRNPVHLLSVNNIESKEPDPSLDQFLTESVHMETSVHTDNYSAVNKELPNGSPSELKINHCISEKELDNYETSYSCILPSDEPECPIFDVYQKVDWVCTSPKLIARADVEFRSSTKFPSNNYLRGCLWSPDGSCILTNSHDNVLRLFNLPSSILSPNIEVSSEPEEMRSVLTMYENELIYDYCWYPQMCSSDPVSCCLASTSRRNPIRLWDAFTGVIRATYIPVNHLGEVVSASSISFSSNGSRLYAGFHRYIQVFDVCRPGSDSIRRPKLGKKPFQGGIISSIGVLNDPNRNIYATGSYNGTVCIFSEPGNLIAQLFSHPTGVTQVTLAKTFGRENAAPWYVLAGGRMDSRLVVWDARNLVDPITIVYRRIENHQKFQFDLEPTGRYLFTGSQTGVVCVYDLPQCIGQFSENSPTYSISNWRAHSDSANSVSVHPSLPIIATSSGQRRVKQPTFKKSEVRSTTEVSTSENYFSNVNNPETSTDSDSSTSCDEKVLNDSEATVMTPPVTGVTTSGESDSAAVVEKTQLPLKGKLTLIPRENRLNLWTFPLLETK